MPQDNLRWKVAAGSPNASMKGPYADITADHATVWFEMDSYGRVQHVTSDLQSAEKDLLARQQKARDSLHQQKFVFKDGEVYVDGLSGGRNRMMVYFTFGRYGNDPWDQAAQDRVTEAIGRVLDYKSQPKTASSKTADAEYSPDPLTYKAFLSEFKQGVVAGTSEAEQASTGFETVGVHGYIAAADDLVTASARDLLDLAKRMDLAANRGRATIGINEHRLIPKLSGILSTFFYNIGKLRGLQHGNPES